MGETILWGGGMILYPFNRPGSLIANNGCACSPCDKPAVATHQWGGILKPQIADLCEAHAAQLWEMLNPLLQINEVWYTIGPLPLDTKQKE